MPRPVRMKPFVLAILAATAVPCGDRAALADWELKPDPPQEAVSLEFQDDFKIDFPATRFSNFHRPYFSGSGGRFVFLAQSDAGKSAHRTLWDLKEKKQIAHIEGGPTGGDQGRLSPDGRWFAQKENSALRVWALDGTNRVKAIAAGGYNLDAFEFLPGDRLLTISSDRKEPSLVVWDLNSADAIQKQKEEIEVDPKSVAVSPGRNWLAALRKHKNDLLFIDLRTLKVRETIALGKPNGGSWHSCDGMAFSPDGKELAGVLYGSREYAVRVWDMATGQETLQIPIQGSILGRKFRSSDNGDFHWLPGGRGWLARGETLVDRAAKRTVATISMKEPDRLATPPIPIDANHLAVVTGDKDARTLTLLKIPYDRIEAALKAAESDTPAALRPGQAVSLKFDLPAVRFADKAKVEDELKKAFASALKTSNLTVADDAPATLAVHYEESAGKPVSFQSRPFPIPRFNPFAPRPQPAPDADKGASSGTGFVLTADGYAATCAHVVGGAKTVQVKIGDKKHEAKVVAKDTENDLALLKFDAKDLDTLPLADSDKVELGEELRVFGHPLSDELGDSVKATRGSLAGIVMRNKRKLFQIDAAVNPGNSGGPTVDEKGNVVGVTTAKIVGTKIDNVGLAVPSNTLKKLLDENKVKPASEPTAAKLEGPALFKRVAKAVVMVVSTSSGGDGTNPEGTFTSTVIKAELTLTAKGGKDALWSQTLTADPSVLTVTAKPSDESIREAVFRHFQSELGSMALPYYISADDSTLRLPLQLEVPK